MISYEVSHYTVKECPFATVRKYMETPVHADFRSVFKFTLASPALTRRIDLTRSNPEITSSDVYEFGTRERGGVERNGPRCT